MYKRAGSEERGTKDGDIEMREEILRMEHICCMDEGVLELDYLKMKAVIAGSKLIILWDISDMLRS